VHHLDEMAGAVRSTVEVALFRGAFELFTSRSARNVAPAGRQRREERGEAFHDVVFAADHHAVAAFQAPDAAAGSDVHVVDFLRRQLLRAPDVVDLIGIAVVDEDVARLQKFDQIGDAFIDHCGGNHQPQSPGLLQLLDQVGKRTCPDRFLGNQFFHCFF